MSITFFMRKIGPVHVAEPSLTAGGRQVGYEIQVDFENLKITVHQKIQIFASFNQVTASL